MMTNNFRIVINGDNAGIYCGDHKLFAIFSINSEDLTKRINDSLESLKAEIDRLKEWND